MDGRPKHTRSRVVTEIFGDQGFARFWETRFLPRWLPLLLALGLGLILALLIVNQVWYFALGLTLAVPAAILLIRYPFAGVLIWLLVLPYFLGGSVTGGKLMFWVLHRTMVPAALGLAVLSGWLGISKKRPARVGPAEWSMLLFLGLLYANILLFNENSMRAIVDAYDELVIPFCMYGLIRVSAPDEKDMKRLLGVAVITLVAQIFIGLGSWFVPQLLPSQWRGLAGERVVGSLRNVAVYTSTLLFMGVLLLHQGLRSGSRMRRLGSLVIFALVLYAVFISFSRGSWVGVSVVMIGLLFVYPKTMIRFALVLGIIALVLGTTVLSDQVAWGYERLTSARAANSAESRMTAFDASIRMTGARPFFGWGYGNFDEAKEPFLRRVGDIQIHEATSHNTFLTVSAELGLIALLLYLFPLGWWLVHSLRIRRKLPREGFFGPALLALLWLVMLHMFIVVNFMDMIRYFHFGTTIWWLLLGLIANIVNPYLDPHGMRAPAETAIGG